MEKRVTRAFEISNSWIQTFKPRLFLTAFLACAKKEKCARVPVARARQIVRFNIAVNCLFLRQIVRFNIAVDYKEHRVIFCEEVV